MSGHIARPTYSVMADCSLIFAAVVAIGVLHFTGCGESAPKVPFAPVSGTVSYQGKPLGHGQIVMIHSSGAMTAGEIGAGGRYAIKAPVGENRIMIVCRDPKVVEHPLKPPADLIPGRYADYMSSGLTLNVIDGANTKDWILGD